MSNQNLLHLSSSLFAFEKSIFFPLFDSFQYPWDIQEEITTFFLKKKKPFKGSYPFVFFQNKNSIFIEEGVTIAPGAFIEGPCYLGKNVSIGHSALIRAGTFLAPNVHIGHCSEISRSIFF